MSPSDTDEHQWTIPGIPDPWNTYHKPWQGNGKRVIFPIGNPRNVYFETFQNRRQDRGQNLSKTCAKTIQNRSLEGVWAPIAVKVAFQADFGRIWGSSWKRLGRSLGRLGGVLKPSWDRLGAFWERLGAVLGRLGPVLGPSWGSLGASWGGLGAVLGGSWGVLGPSWAILDHLGPKISYEL